MFVTAVSTQAQTQPVTVSATLLTLTEGGVGKSYTVKLNNRPDGDVTVTIKGTDDQGTLLSIGGHPLGGGTTSLSVSPWHLTLTFTTSNWDVPQTVNLIAQHDANAAHEVVTLSHTASGGGYDSGYDSVEIPVQTVKVEIADDDNANTKLVSIAAAQDSVTEGDPAVFTLTRT